MTGRKILFPIDGTPDSVKAVQWAISNAILLPKDQLYVFFLFPVGEEDKMDAILYPYQDILTEAQMSLVSCCFPQRPNHSFEEELTRVAEDRDFFLLILSRRNWLNISLKTSLPVALLSFSPIDSQVRRKVMFCVDGSRESKRVFNWAVKGGVFCKEDAVFLVHAYSDVMQKPKFQRMSDSEWKEKITALNLAKVATVFQPFSSSLTAGKILFTEHALHTLDYAESLVHAVSNLRPDLVVIGHQGNSSVDSDPWSVGTVARALLEKQTRASVVMWKGYPDKSDSSAHRDSEVSNDDYISEKTGLLAVNEKGGGGGGGAERKGTTLDTCPFEEGLEKDCLIHAAAAQQNAHSLHHHEHGEEGEGEGEEHHHHHEHKDHESDGDDHDHPHSEGEDGKERTSSKGRNSSSSATASPSAAAAAGADSNSDRKRSDSCCHAKPRTVPSEAGRKVLVAIDATKPSQHAFSWALAKGIIRTDDLLWLCHVHDPSNEKCESVLTECLDECAHRNIWVRSLLLPAAAGDVQKMICQTAAQNEFDLIVTGSGGHSLARRLLRGSVSGYIAHMASVPTLVIRPHEDIILTELKHRRKIMLAVCDDGGSRRAFQYVLCKDFVTAADIVFLVYICPLIKEERPPHRPVKLWKEYIDQASIETAIPILQDYRSKLSSLEIDYTEHIMPSDDANGGLSTAIAELQPDLIVLGGDVNQSGRFHAGNTTGHVLRNCKCPVLVCKTIPEKRPTAALAPTALEDPHDL